MLVDSSDLCNNYIVMDDGHTPYENYEWKSEISHNVEKKDRCKLENYEPEMLMVPLLSPRNNSSHRRSRTPI